MKFLASKSARVMRRRGQVVTEYVMILTLVVMTLAATKLKINADGSLDLTGAAGSKTVMERMSDSFTVWFQDIVIIISLPT